MNFQRAEVLDSGYKRFQDVKRAWVKDLEAKGLFGRKVVTF
jgi:hypothetical protein